MQLNDITKFVNIKGFVIKNIEENEENIFLDGELSKKPNHVVYVIQNI